MPNTETTPGPGAWDLTRLVPWLIVGFGLVVVLVTPGDSGATFDEGLQARYGELCLQYFESGGQDKACNSYFNLRFYGPLVEMISAFWYTPGDPAN